MHSRKKKAIAFFSVVFIAYASLAVYYYFYAPALEFFMKDGKLYLMNKSTHEIRDVRVISSEGKMLAYIELLQGLESKLIELPTDRKLAFVIAKAPLHREAKIEFIYAAPEGKTFDFSLSPRTAKVGKETEFVATICNKSPHASRIILEESHKSDEFEGKTKIFAGELASNECKKIKYTLTPLKKGELAMQFYLRSGIASYIFKNYIQVGD